MHPYATVKSEVCAGRVMIVWVVKVGFSSIGYYVLSSSLLDTVHGGWLVS